MNLSSSVCLSNSTWKCGNAPIRKLLQNIPTLAVWSLFLICNLNLLMAYELCFCANSVFKPKWILSLPDICLLGVFIDSSHVTFSFHFVKLEKTHSYILLRRNILHLLFYSSCLFWYLPHSFFLNKWPGLGAALCVPRTLSAVRDDACYLLRQPSSSCLNTGLQFYTDIA